MGSISKKIKRNTIDHFTINYNFQCTKCFYVKKIPEQKIKAIRNSVNSNNEWSNHPAWKCPKCNTRMDPIQIIADY